jgi:hypothetical protein
MTKIQLVDLIDAFLVKLPVGLRFRMFQYANQQGIRDDFASLRYQLNYCLDKLHSDLLTECNELIKRYDSFVQAECGVWVSV